MAPDFNPIARLYYPLSRLVFGSSQLRAQQTFVHLVGPGSRILIAGGGNGHLLRYLPESCAAASEIFFVEPAPDMMAMARKKTVPSPHIHFIQTTVEQFLGSSGPDFDVVITAFFFDLFPQHEAGSLFSLINARLRPGGLWLYTDFQLAGGSLWWQAPLLKMMYFFFRQVSEVKASFLPDMAGCWKNRYRLLAGRSFYGRFIIAQAWQKNPV
ncbi:MAG: hypothetical protein ABS46_03500 [Cytophagaceae bacterium SCN 52-12]|nr:MAG: hypothetical protein ABS46_03500 [Cytophagaceae bacterium SCN 52-12]